MAGAPQRETICSISHYTQISIHRRNDFHIESAKSQTSERESSPLLESLKIGDVKWTKLNDLGFSERSKIAMQVSLLEPHTWQIDVTPFDSNKRRGSLFEDDITFLYFSRQIVNAMIMVFLRRYTQDSLTDTWLATKSTFTKRLRRSVVELDLLVLQKKKIRLLR